MYRPPTTLVTPTAKPIANFFPQSSSGTHAFIHFDIVQTEKYRKGTWQLTGSQRGNFDTKYGLKMPSFKRYLTAIFLDLRLDPQLAEEIRLAVHRFFPVRSGRLYDIFSRTLRLFRAQWYKTHLMVYFRYLWTIKRPYPITGKVQHKGEFGWAEYYNPQTVIPNVQMVARKKGSKQALYLLNDPLAQNNPTYEINLHALKIIEKDFRARYENLILWLNI